MTESKSCALEDVGNTWMNFLFVTFVRWQLFSQESGQVFIDYDILKDRGNKIQSPSGSAQ